MKAVAVGLLLLSILGVPFANADASYSYLDIHPAGWLESRAVSVNARGEVAGYGLSASGERGFVWYDGAYTEILPPGASGARAYWVNGNGDVAGTAVIDGRSRAFLYRNGAYLDPTPGWAYSEALFVGEDGTVTGTGEFGGYVSRDGVAQVLPEFSTVVGANTSGQILGIAENTAKLFLPGKGYLNLCPPGASSAVPRGINESGLVAVSSLDADTEKGYVYSGGFFVYMTPPGWSSSIAMSINGQSQVVGYGVSPEGRRGFLRTGSSYEEIAFPGWTATEAISINDLGQVSGSGVTAGGEIHGFIASQQASASVATGGEASGGTSAGGGCSLARGRRNVSTPEAMANLLALFLPGLILAFRRRCGRER